MVTVPCLITVAAGVLAPGHLGELTRYLPFELADDVLESTRTVQKRMRALPSRVGIYFVLALALFPGVGYLRVWGKMTAALEDLGLPRPSEKALRDLRRRLGPAPVKAMFESVAVPLAPPGTPGVFYQGLRTVAFDGLNSVKVPDSGRNRSWLGKTMTCLGLAGYPAMRMVVLAETGTRGLLGAVIGGKGERSEVPLAPQARPAAARGDAAAGRPRLRRGRPAEGSSRGRGARPGPRQRRPQAPGPGGLARRVLPVPDRRPRGADHRGGPGRARRRRHPARGRLPADHHLAGLAPLPGRGIDPPLP
jgi:hypothetical protein